MLVIGFKQWMINEGLDHRVFKQASKLTQHYYRLKYRKFYEETYKKLYQ